MVMKKPKHPTNKFLLAYFIDSSLWKNFKDSIVDNYAYWVNEDPNRASRMYAARTFNKKGYTVAEHLYDMIDCIYTSKLKPKTKSRLFNELDEVERWHEFNGTLENEL